MHHLVILKLQYEHSPYRKIKSCQVHLYLLRFSHNILFETLKSATFKQLYDYSVVNILSYQLYACGRWTLTVFHIAVCHLISWAVIQTIALSCEMKVQMIPVFWRIRRKFYPTDSSTVHTNTYKCAQKYPETHNPDAPEFFAALQHRMHWSLKWKITAICRGPNMWNKTQIDIQIDRV